MEIPHDLLDLADIDEVDFRAYSSAVLTTHGQFGEDGLLQGFLETLGVEYTGSGVLASAIAMHKPTANLLAESAGLRVPATVVLTPNSSVDEVATAIADLSSDCIIRPSTGGGSRGVLRSADPAALADHMQQWADSFDEFLLSEFITGTEVSVALRNNSAGLQIFPILATYHDGDFYDYRIKHDAGARRHVCPADLPTSAIELIEERSAALYRKLKLTGFVRMDYLVDAAGESWFLEVNTLPGMSRQGNLATMAAAAGMTYEQLVTEFALTAGGVGVTQS
jgi:D-alanine-D-alanine ligase